MIIGKKQTVAETIEAFVSAGNTFIGPIPEGGVGDLIIDFGKPGILLQFGAGCTVKKVIVTCPLGGATIRTDENVMLSAKIRTEPGCLVDIGSGTFFQRQSRLVLYEGASILVGKDCLFSNVTLRTSDQHAIYDAETDERLNPSADILIEDRVWLAEQVTVQKGVMIGHDCVIGSHSIVTKSIPPGCIAAGIPAKVKRTGVRWTKKMPRVASMPARPYEPNTDARHLTLLK